MNKRSLPYAAVLAAVVSSFCLGGSAADKISDNAKVFQAELEAMKGQAPRAILDKLLAWKFEPMSAWTTEDAASDDFKTKNKGKAKFTKKEIAEVFGQAGKYKIAVYGLLVGTESATTGEVDELGRTVMKDASVSVQIFTTIRIVFRDEKLISVRTWPKMESSAVTGGTRYIR
jgi:hypothetical protein